MEKFAKKFPKSDEKNPKSDDRLANPRMEMELQELQEGQQKRSDHARKAADARWGKDARAMPEQCPSNPQAMPENAILDPESESDPKEEKRGAPRKRFKPPTIEEAAEYGDAYAKEKDASFDAEVFCAFYESKNWMVGKNKMVDWRGSVRGWIGRNRDDAKDIPTIPSGEW